MSHLSFQDLPNDMITEVARGLDERDRFRLAVANARLAALLAPSIILRAIPLASLGWGRVSMHCADLARQGAEMGRWMSGAGFLLPEDARSIVIQTPVDPRSGLRHVSLGGRTVVCRREQVRGLTEGLGVTWVLADGKIFCPRRDAIFALGPACKLENIAVLRDVFMHGVAILATGRFRMEGGGVRQTEVGILVAEGGRAVLRDVAVEDNVANGLVVSGRNSTIKMTGGGIRRHKTGVLAEKGGVADLRGVAVESNKECGLAVHGQDSGIKATGGGVQGSRIGISVEEGGRARLRNFTVERHAECGVSVTEDGTELRMEGGVVRHCALGLFVGTCGRATAKDVAFEGNAEVGVYVKLRARVDMEGGFVRGSRQGLSAEGDAVLRSVAFEDNEFGVSLRGPSTLRFEDGNVRRSKSGIYVNTGRMLVKRVEIEDVLISGASVVCPGSELEMEGGAVRRSGCGVFVATGGNATLTGVTVEDATEWGILATDDGSRAEVVGGKVRRCSTGVGARRRGEAVVGDVAFKDNDEDTWADRRSEVRIVA